MREGRRRKTKRKKNKKEGKKSEKIRTRHPHWKALVFLGTSTERRLIGYSFLFSSNNRRELCQKCNVFQYTVTFQKPTTDQQHQTQYHLLRIHRGSTIICIKISHTMCKPFRLLSMCMEIQLLVWNNGELPSYLFSRSHLWPIWKMEEKLRTKGLKIQPYKRACSS